jgi:hypothetical protein
MFKSIKDNKLQRVVILSGAKNLAWLETTAGPFAAIRVTKPVSMSNIKRLVIFLFLTIFHSMSRYGSLVNPGLCI